MARPGARGLGPSLGLGLKYEIVLRAGPGLDIIAAGRAGPRPHSSICGPDPGQVCTTAAGPGRAWASNHVCGPGLGLDFRPVQGPTPHPRLEKVGSHTTLDHPVEKSFPRHCFPCSPTAATDHIHGSGRPCRSMIDTRWKDASLHLPSEVADIYIRRGVLISCLSQCHLQVGWLHVKKQVGTSIRRKIAKPEHGLRLCVQVISRFFHGCVWFLAV